MKTNIYLAVHFSVHKALRKINGFDENYEGPGLGEDPILNTDFGWQELNSDL
ncbi:MAG: hypothetical protein IPH77_06065 [Ignavibacteria bacterium]|nr:hypothetical protein [Ignavibacteria bacterium]